MEHKTIMIVCRKQIPVNKQPEFIDELSYITGNRYYNNILFTESGCFKAEVPHSAAERLGETYHMWHKDIRCVNELKAFFNRFDVECLYPDY